MGIDMILGIVLLVMSIAMVVLVMLQPGKDQRSAAISGGSSDTFFSKSKSNTKEKMLEKITVVMAILMFVLMIVMYCIV